MHVTSYFPSYRREPHQSLGPISIIMLLLAAVAFREQMLFFRYFIHRA